MYDVVDVAVATDAPSVREPTARYDLSNIDFSRLRAEFEKSPFKNVVAMNLMEKIEERLAAMVARNPTRVDLYERYQEIVQEYNKDKDAAEIQKVMDDLFASMTIAAKRKNATCAKDSIAKLNWPCSICFRRIHSPRVIVKRSRKSPRTYWANWPINVSRWSACAVWRPCKRK